MAEQGLLVIQGNAELEAEKRAKEAAEKDLENRQRVVSSLGGHLQRLWQEAKNSKENKIQEGLLENLRYRNGVYDDAKAQQFSANGGCVIWVGITETKCVAAEAWIKDVLLPANEKPWTLEPSPIPSLNPELEAGIIEETRKWYMEQMVQSFNGMAPQPGIEDVYNFAADMRTSIMKELTANARDTAQRMDKTISDQLLEGGFYSAFEDVIKDLCTFKSAILKGPVVRREKRLRWAQGQDGRWTPQIENKPYECFERVSPFDFYPSPNCTNAQKDGYVFEKIHMSRKDLYGLKGVEGYKDSEIDAALMEFGDKGYLEPSNIDTSRETLENKDNATYGEASDRPIDVLEFWGSAQGRMLKEWGLAVEDDVAEYDIWAVTVGGHVIKAEINPDELGCRPYYVTSFEKIPGAVWGKSIPDKIKDLQDICNAAVREMVNNLAYSSGPQVVINTAFLPSGMNITTMTPRKIWQIYDKNGQAGNPVNFIDVPSNTEKLIGVYDKFKNESDETTGVPRYIYGDEAASGAGATARGLAMLMNAAAKGLRAVISNLDKDIIKPLIERMYRWNMIYSDDETIKGDLFVKARGALSLVVKEQTQQARQEFLTQAVTNETIMKIVGEKGIANLLRETVKSLDLEEHNIVPTDEEVMARQREEQMMMAAMQAQQMYQQRQAQGGGETPPPQGEGGQPIPGQEPKEPDEAAQTSAAAGQQEIPLTPTGLPKV